MFSRRDATRNAAPADTAIAPPIAEWYDHIRERVTKLTNGSPLHSKTAPPPDCLRFCIPPIWSAAYVQSSPILNVFPRVLSFLPDEPAPLICDIHSHLQGIPGQASPSRSSNKIYSTDLPNFIIFVKRFSFVHTHPCKHRETSINNIIVLQPHFLSHKSIYSLPIPAMKYAEIHRPARQAGWASIKSFALNVERISR